MKKVKFLSFPKFDSKIYWTFGCFLLIGIIFLTIQYYRHVDCEKANYFIHSEDWSVNQVVEFYDNTSGAQTWKWDFGDGSATDIRRHTFHRYTKPGEYIVTLTINGSCQHQKTISISSVSQSVGYLANIDAPDVVFVGERVRFHAEKEGGISFEWSFGETYSTDALGQTVYYTFKKEGKKKISLMVNGDVEHIATKDIYVAPKRIIAKQPIDIKTYEFEKPHESFSLPMGEAQKDPLVDMLSNIPVAPKSNTAETKNPTIKEILDISNEQFKLMLNKVASEEKTKEDFKEYLCGNYSLPVVVNDNKIIPFEQFCQAIAGKKIKIKTLRLDKDTNHCIQNINIHYKEKFIFFYW
ncbi:PKD domain-containing protein [Ornithobacterium rhinotracheale]|uniref:PKD domain-containing protein n=1 Tax=Ornithobacterium rhinotracheale TaxID=28251 RepID=A0A410JPZ7_ORNRH|nr:PKD domain-containing protein [Ornithobacterium rhinotracheale]QAR30247.1 PKD domain-containing protein [Ornithobacterium rhinotracheale]